MGVGLSNRKQGYEDDEVDSGRDRPNGVIKRLKISERNVSKARHMLSSHVGRREGGQGAKIPINMEVDGVKETHD